MGQPAIIITDAFPGRIFEGRIVRLAPELKESSRAARMEVEIPNDDLALKPGMFVRVAVEYASRPDVLTVPIGALVKRNERQGVFMADMESRTARFVPVQLGIVSGGYAEVIEPALTGKIITLGQHLLSDKAPILLQAAPANLPGGPPAE
jgi:multidrug efflux pump subunit AcrA (membrane-fusion protein)